MKQEISNAIPGEGSQVSRRTPVRIHFYRRMGLILTAALMLIVLSAFTSVSSAHASTSVSSAHASGCWSYQTWSNNATSADNGTPQMYARDGSGPRLGLGLNSCQQYIMIKWSDGGYDYYKIDWTRPGLSNWQEFRVAGQSYDGYFYKNFPGIYYGTYYNFAVKGCISHWYGDSCDDWSPTVGITT